MNFIKKFIDNYKDQSRRDAENAVKQEAAIAALQGGAIFPRAKERIDREKALGRNFFSSDLTVREYLLSREAQFETIGQVMGSCFFSISLLGLMGRAMGLTQSEYNHDKFISTRGSIVKESSELVDITAAQLKARRNAVDRMLLEAKELGAHGVIGVRVKASHFNWATRLTEFTAIGTAIRLPSYQSDGTVFTSDLNGQEFWQLYNAGYIPKELSFGVCTYYIKCDPETRQIIDPTLIDFMKGRSANNQEIALFSQGFYEARNLAMERLTSDAMAVKADGIVSVDVDYDVQTVEYMQSNKTFHDPVVHFIATGTSIRKVEGHSQPIPKPKMCLSLRGGTWVDIGSFESFIPSSLSDPDDFDDE